jgi:transposase
MLKDRSRHIREAAVKAFEKLGTRDDIPKIQKMLDNVELRSTAYHAIKEILQRYESKSTEKSGSGDASGMET